MNPIQHAHLLVGLETLIRDARDDGPAYEALVMVEIIIKQASDGDFKGAILALRRLQVEVSDANPLDISIVAPPVVLY